MHKTIAILAVILLVLAGILVLRSFRAPEGGSFEEEKRDLATEERPRHRPVRASPEPEPVSPGEELASAAAAPPIREPVEGGILVRCIERGTGRPVPSADVFVWAGARRSWAEGIVGLLHPERERRISDRYRADERGLVRVAAPDGGLVAVEARAPDLFGVFRPQGDSGPLGGGPRDLLESGIAIELREEPTLSVRVLDSSGRPLAGVPVVWGITPGPRDEDVGGEGRSFLGRGRGLSRDGDGRVDFQFGDRELMEIECPCVALDGITRRRIVKPLDLEGSPAETVALVAPPSGSLSISFEPGSIAVPAGRDFLVSVQENRRDEEGRLFPIREVPSAHMTLETGRGRCELVETGLELVIRLDPGPFATFSPIEQIVAGPRRAGECVEVVFRPPEEPDRLVLSGRLLLPAGEPCADSDFGVEIVRESEARAPGIRRAEGRTDSRGRFSLGLGVDADVAAAFATSRFTLSRPSGETLTADGPRMHLRLGRQELGDLVLEGLPLLASGRVLDGLGQPVEGVIVRAYRRRHPRDYRGPEFPDLDIRATTAADGHFAFSGTAAPPRFTVQLEADGARSEPRMVDVGATNVDFVVARLATLKLRVETKDVSARQGLAVCLVDSANAEREIPIQPDGLVIARVEPGSYSLRIMPLDGSGSAFYWQDGIVVPEGQTVDLGTIDLGPRGRLLRLHLVNGEGRAIEDGRISFRTFQPGSSDPIASDSRWLRSPVMMLFVPELPVEVEIAMAGYRLTRKVVAKETETIVLEPALAVRLLLQGLGDFPGDATIRLTLRSIERGTWNQQVNVALRGGEKEVLVGVPVPGRYAVDAFLFLQPGRGPGVEDILTLARDPGVDVRQTDRDQLFDVVLDREALAETLTELRRLVEIGHAQESVRDRLRGEKTEGR